MWTNLGYRTECKIILKYQEESNLVFFSYHTIKDENSNIICHMQRKTIRKTYYETNFLHSLTFNCVGSQKSEN
jgi:hypothetical protein